MKGCSDLAYNKQIMSLAVARWDANLRGKSRVLIDRFNFKL